MSIAHPPNPVMYFMYSAIVLTMMENAANPAVLVYVRTRHVEV